MNLRHILIPVLACVMIAGGAAGAGQHTNSSDHTAVAVIEVLPYVQPDPLSLEAPAIDVELQREFRRSQAVLMTRASFFDRLVKRDKVRGTKWFHEMGGDLKRAAKDLQQRSAVDARKDSSFLEVVVACDDPNDSALIADEMGLGFKGLLTPGIRRRFQWEVYCPGCRRTFDGVVAGSNCNICGTPLKRRPSKKTHLKP